MAQQKRDQLHLFLPEKAHLKPVSSIKHKDISFRDSITATVNKDDMIRFKGNRYSVPLGTYTTVASNQGHLHEDDQKSVILHKVTDDEIARHPFSEEYITIFIDKIMEKYKRYSPDQFMLLEKSIRTYS